MIYEVEQKYRVSSFESTEIILRELNGSFQRPICQVDSYFSHPSRDFAATDEAFRIRQVGESNFVTYKGPKIDQETKTRHELELPLPDGEKSALSFAELFIALGFSHVTDVCKKRTPLTVNWDNQTLDVSLDEVHDLGQFVELEITADENQLGDAKRSVLSLAKKLGLVDHERRSYLELLLEAK